LSQNVGTAYYTSYYRFTHNLVTAIQALSLIGAIGYNKLDVSDLYSLLTTVRFDNWQISSMITGQREHELG
jgi:hypothetical protein